MALTLSTKALNVKPSSTLAITAKAKQLKIEGRDIVGFGAGEPDFATPKNICDAAVQAINDGNTKYTAAAGTLELRKAVSAKFKRFNHLEYSPDQIVITNGGKQGLTNVFRAIINQGDEVIIPAPYWLSYPELVKLAGGVPVFVYGQKENGYKISSNELQKAVTPKTKAVILCNPSNPTGAIYNKAELEDIADFVVKNDIFCVSDEMYENLVYTGEEFVSFASLSKEAYEHTITCSGLSKSYAMTGWRVGYTGSTLEVAKRMSAVQSHCTANVNSIAQAAAIEALNGPQDSVNEMCKAFDERRKYMYERLQKMPYIDCARPEGAFYVFIDFTKTIGMDYREKDLTSAAEIAYCLLEDYDTAVVPCQDFGFPNHIRLSYATSMEQIKKGLDRIEKFLGELSDD